MKPLALAVSLCLAACAHASPLTALGAAASARLQPSPEAQAQGLRDVATLDAVVRTPHRTIAAVASAAAPVAREAGLEALASAPVVIAAAAGTPGPLGMLLAVWEAVKANPALDGLILCALIGALFALAFAFHLISREKALKWIPFWQAFVNILQPISKATPTPLDDVVELGAEKVLAELLKLAAQGETQQPGLAAVLADAHDAAGVPVPAVIAKA